MEDYIAPSQLISMLCKTDFSQNVQVFWLHTTLLSAAESYSAMQLLKYHVIEMDRLPVIWKTGSLF